MHTSWRPITALAITIIAWAGAYPSITLALRDFDPIPLAAVRFAVASIPMLVWLAWQRPPLPAKADALRIIACGVIGIALYNILLNTGQRTVSASASSFIINTQPVMAALLATFVLGESFRARAWLGTAVSLGGIGLIAVNQPGGLSFGAGATLVLAAALCSAVFFVIQKPLVARYGAFACAALTILIGAACLSPWLPLGMHQLVHASRTGTVAALFLGIFPGALAYVTWMIALDHFGAARATNFLYLMAPLATLFAFLFAAEVPAWTTLAGGALALCGVVLVNARARGNNKVKQPLAL